MYYYEVWIGDHRYHGDKPLTYASENQLSVGSVVTVPLQKRTVPAVVAKKVNPPEFATKPIVRVIADQAVPAELLALLEWMTNYYPAPRGQIYSLALPATLTTKSRTPEAEDLGSPNALAAKQLSPSAEQARALTLLAQHPDTSVLLHGNTGTGKTLVYLERAREIIANGKSVIILTPEIGLTSQLKTAVEAVFPGQAVMMHSGLSSLQRRREWMRITNAKQPLLVVGPRSALFTSLKNIGLIVVDEFHETAYKQEQAPHYLAQRVAGKLAQLHGAQLILGSATPPVADYYMFRQKNLPIIRMKKPAITHEHGEAAVRIIDRKDRSAFTRSSWIADELLDAIQTAHHNDQQSLVFLNRRGTAKLIVCNVCGWHMLCPHCDVTLTYHDDKHNVRCHTCGHHAPAPTDCQNCGSTDIIFRNPGTKSIVHELERLLPSLKIKRFDSDTPSKERLEHLYDSIREGSADVLVGTQMLGKGLDLPKLSVLGIITAETSLAFPDYTAEERTYQSLTQALGRVHRGHLPGTAIIQTFDPSSELIQDAIANNYEAFYERQLAERKMFRFPPFRFTLVLTCARATDASAQRNAMAFADTLRSHPSAAHLEIDGPAPAFVPKAQGSYRWRITVKAINRSRLVDVIRNLPRNWSYDIDPTSLL